LREWLAAVDDATGQNGVEIADQKDRAILDLDSPLSDLSDEFEAEDEMLDALNEAEEEEEPDESEDKYIPSKFKALGPPGPHSSILMTSST